MSTARGVSPWTTAPGSPRGTRVPPAVYARSAKTSCTGRSPAASACSSQTAPGSPRTAVPGAPRTTAATTAAARATWVTTAL
ncbi:hypothetical protein AWH69_04420 [Janibacter melonis]|uniref:Uncharacterized protein n=1 Tax=Janibacter melonis TaxID=262209 RepID=A0A176QGR5_9MICO|nr:hypothetical protein AWH69_04420 [Janibacter melonis]